jgi:hypothetical protein
MFLLEFRLSICFAYLEKLGEVWKLHQGSAKDPLQDAVDVLESNRRLARDVL